MVHRIKEAMEPYSVGLFIVGLGHLHSTLLKLKAVGFDIRGYSWLGINWRPVCNPLHSPVLPRTNNRKKDRRGWESNPSLVLTDRNLFILRNTRNA